MRQALRVTALPRRRCCARGASLLQRLPGSWMGMVWWRCDSYIHHTYIYIMVGEVEKRHSTGCDASRG